MFGEFAFGEPAFGDVGVYTVVISGPDVLYVTVVGEWPSATAAGPFPHARLTAASAEWPGATAVDEFPRAGIGAGWPSVESEGW